MTPQPHPEVVNGQPRVLIVGWGHVGQQIGRYFTAADHVDVDGLIQHGERGAPVFVEQYDLGFLCVPTPELPDGSCDVHHVQDAYNWWNPRVRYWCVKSAVSIGTTEALGPNVCVSPELYGETTQHPLVAVTPDHFEILGGPPEVTRAFAEAWSLVTNSYSHIYQADARTVELCKLMENSWIATKVSFVNQFYDLAALAGVDWHTLRELWLADPRVSRSHTYVFPHNRGWGGKCLPKDTANLCAWARAQGQPAELIEAVREYNRHCRECMKCE